jgi:D-alanyl-D-alanine carboxypeptidase
VTRAVLAAVCVLVAATTGPTAASAPPTRALDQALAAGLRRTGAPGAQAAVYRCGRLVWSGVAGVVDLHSQRRVTADTRFVIASTTKFVTATMIMQLVERGRLSLSTPLARFYPRLPNARAITLRMLLTHTSGLPEYLDNPAIARTIANDPTHRWTRDEVLLGVRRAAFRPGSRFSYSNTNFVVLGGILERVGHLAVEQAFRTGIAAPLHLGRSSFSYRPALSRLFAHPYQVGDDGRAVDEYVPGLGISSDYWGPVWTDGGLATTAEELARIGDAVFTARLVRPATLRAMTTINRFESGLGLFPGPFDGDRWFGHEGSYGGFESELWHDPARGTTIAVTTDMDERSGATPTSEQIWDGIARAYDRATGPVHACGGSSPSFS